MLSLATCLRLEELHRDAANGARARTLDTSGVRDVVAFHHDHKADHYRTCARILAGANCEVRCENALPPASHNLRLAGAFRLIGRIEG